jgi:hypothetical protein
MPKVRTEAMTDHSQFSPLDPPYLKMWRERMGSIGSTKPLVSQAVIDASDKLLADIEAKVNADPVLKAKCDKVRKDALASIAREKKRKKRKKAA